MGMLCDVQIQLGVPGVKGKAHNIGLPRLELPQKILGEFEQANIDRARIQVQDIGAEKPDGQRHRFRMDPDRRMVKVAEGYLQHWVIVYTSAGNDGVGLWAK